jgi:hypothetical protein
MPQAAVNQSSPPELWKIYDHPPEHPHAFVARRFVIGRGVVVQTDDVLPAPDLGVLQRHLDREGFTAVKRHDEPGVLEHWL